LANVALATLTAVLPDKSAAIWERLSSQQIAIVKRLKLAEYHPVPNHLAKVSP